MKHKYSMSTRKKLTPEVFTIRPDQSQLVIVNDSTGCKNIISVEEHEHPFPEARWVLSGFLRVYIGDEVVDLGPGDRLDLPPGMKHRFEVIGLSPAVFVTGSTQAAATAR